jgi:predicted sugar kinase
MTIYANARIGITSEDLKNTIEKTLGGAGLALSSPRLIIPAVIYGLSALSHHFQNSFFSFEVRTPLRYCTGSYLIGRLCQIYHHVLVTDFSTRFFYYNKYFII